jgi:3-phosphoshikimate 1-carboxyvinyltransferase
MAELSLPVGRVPLFKGEVEVPGSKSISNRLLLMNYLAGDPLASIRGLSTAGDTLRMQNVLAALKLPHSDGEVGVGDAGTVMRFVLPLLCLTPGTHHMTGTERAHERPIGPLVDALRLLGAQIQYLGRAGCLPLKIEGGTALRMPDGLDAIPVDAGMSSQFVSALMMLAPCIEGGLRLRLIARAVSRPYLLLTRDLMREWGVPIEFNHENNINIPQCTYQPPARVEVEPDWSSAAYWLAWTALMPQSELFVPNLKRCSLQADAICADAFADLGVHSIERDGGLLLSNCPMKMPSASTDQTKNMMSYASTHQTKNMMSCASTDQTKNPMSAEWLEYADPGSSTFKPGEGHSTLQFSGLDSPDLIPTAMVLCALKGRAARFTELETLRVKESDRLGGLMHGLRSLGARIDEREPGSYRLMQGIPRASIQGQVFDLPTQGDHRMAMAFSLLASHGYGVRPDRPEVVGKSYPGYWQTLERLGMRWQP